MLEYAQLTVQQVFRCCFGPGLAMKFVGGLEIFEAMFAAACQAAASES